MHDAASWLLLKKILGGLAVEEGSGQDLIPCCPDAHSTHNECLSPNIKGLRAIYAHMGF